MVVYIKTQGATVHREGRHLIVDKAGELHQTLFIHRLEQLVIMGNVQLTPQAIKLLLREDVDTVFLRLDGRYIGRLAGREPKNVFLRKRQFILTEDTAFCLAQAKNIVGGKLFNMATVAQRIQRTREAAQAGELSKQIRRMFLQVTDAKSLERLRGLEGQATALYFQSLRLGFQKDWGFGKRVRRPPTDPVNSVLSLLYMFIINRVYAAVRLAGLDPYPGVLHSLEYGRYSLPLDLVEEFRSIIVDTLTLSLFNMGILKESDFYAVEAAPAVEIPDEDIDRLIERAAADSIGTMTVEDDTESFDMPEQPENPADSGRPGAPAIRLHHEAYGKVVTAFERKMSTGFFHPLAERQLDYGEAMIFQARLFRRVVEGEVQDYVPLALR